MRLLGVAAALFAVVALAIAAGAGAFGGSWSPPRGAARPPTTTELRVLAQDALGAAATAGDSHPTAAFVVPTTRQTSQRIAAGAFVESNPDVYFIVVQGNFTLTNAPVPPGSKAPTGTVLTLTINPRRNVSLDNGVGTRMPNLYAMGQPEPLPLPSSG